MRTALWSNHIEMSQTDDSKLGRRPREVRSKDQRSKTIRKAVQAKPKHSFCKVKKWKKTIRISGTNQILATDQQRRLASWEMGPMTEDTAITCQIQLSSSYGQWSWQQMSFNADNLNSRTRLGRRKLQTCRIGTVALSVITEAGIFGLRIGLQQTETETKALIGNVKRTEAATWYKESSEHKNPGN